jgi:hypothetical protein
MECRDYRRIGVTLGDTQMRGRAVQVNEVDL